MPTPSYDFRNKAAVVTGAGGGMGEAIALALAQAGAAVTAIDVKPCPESLKKSDAVHYAQGDLRDGAFVDKTMKAAYERSGRLDYLANVAGVLWFGRDKSLLEMELSVWDEVMDINLRSMVLTSRAATPLMRKTGGGAMVHFSTIQWMRGDPQPPLFAGCADRVQFRYVLPHAQHDFRRSIKAVDSVLLTVAINGARAAAPGRGLRRGRGEARERLRPRDEDSRAGLRFEVGRLALTMAGSSPGGLVGVRIKKRDDPRGHLPGRRPVGRPHSDGRGDGERSQGDDRAR